MIAYVRAIGNRNTTVSTCSTIVVLPGAAPKQGLGSFMGCIGTHWRSARAHVTLASCNGPYEHTHARAHSLYGMAGFAVEAMERWIRVQSNVGN